MIRLFSMMGGEESPNFGGILGESDNKLADRRRIHQSINQTDHHTLVIIYGSGT
jgi:hypothetical protein